MCWVLRYVYLLTGVYHDKSYLVIDSDMQHTGVDNNTARGIANLRRQQSQFLTGTWCIKAGWHWNRTHQRICYKDKNTLQDSPDSIRLFPIHILTHLSEHYTEEKHERRSGVSIKSQSGPDSIVLGSMAASVCERGFAQYTLNMRAALLSGPDVIHEISQARRIHAFAFAKSDTCAMRISVN